MDVDTPACECVDEHMVGGAPLQHHRPQEGEQRFAGVSGLQQLPAAVGHVADPVCDDSRVQRLLGREVAVDRAGPDAGAPGDLVDRDAQPSAANVS